MILWTIFLRDWKQLIRSAQGLLPFFLTLSATGALLVWMLRRAEGSSESLASLWGLAVAFGLPFLASTAASRGFTQDRDSGMIRLMFSTPVRARTWVLGKIAAAWVLCLLYMLAMGGMCWSMVRWFLPTQASLPFMWEGFLFAIFTMALQAALWCSLGILVSLISRSTTAAAFLMLVICFLFPAIISTLFTFCFPQIQPQWEWFPLQEQVYDSAGGLLNIRAMVSYLTLTAVVLYTAGLRFDALRIYGKER